MKGNPFRCLILDNVQNNMGDAAIALAMTSSLKETFGDDSIIKICYCGVTADPGEFTSHYPELNFTRTLWHAVYDGSSPNRTIWSTIVRKSAAYRLPLQAKLSSFGLPNMLLLPGEKELLDEFREADVVVVSGGGFLNTSWTPPSRRSLRIGEYKTALNLKIPLVFYAQSFGPFAENDPFSKQLLPVLRKASAVLCRDLESVDILTNYIGVDTNNIITTIDEALLLHSRPPSRELSPAKIKPLRIGICVHQWLWEKAENGVELQSEFERKIAQASRKLLEQGNVEIALISTHQGIVRALHSDEEVVTRIYYQIPELLRTNVHIVEGFVHPAEFAHFMGHCDLVISSRLHGAILSLVGGAPVVALGYEPKTLGLLSRIGLGNWHLSMWDFDVDELIGKVKSLLGDPQNIKSQLNKAILQGRKIALLNREAVRCAIIGEDLPRTSCSEERVLVN